ncbi:hypothetical protein [Marinilactibacillus kalidii]|uniref:hypothetical protein n=1 Tax=Marinilactibacillus kalidii TaxID=2820274 RepID=UPI001ABE1E0F|nr:hypothetical protein [Marinilactibacillus kalidii]
MKWIEEILTDYNVSNIDLILEEIKKTYPSHAVPKEKYNALSKRVKAIQNENGLLKKLSQAGVRDSEYVLYKLRNTRTFKEEKASEWDKEIAAFKTAYPEQFSESRLNQPERNIIEVVRTIYDNT